MQCSLTSQRTWCTACSSYAPQECFAHGANFAAYFASVQTDQGVLDAPLKCKYQSLAALAAAHLHSRSGAPDPAIVFIDQAANPERAPRLVQVSMQVANGDHARRRGQERGVRRCLRAIKHQPKCTRVFRP